MNLEVIVIGGGGGMGEYSTPPHKDVARYDVLRVNGPSQDGEPCLIAPTLAPLVPSCFGKSYRAGDIVLDTFSNSVIC